MANDEKQPGTNLASGTVILAALVATGAYVFHREAPLQGSRPAITEAGIPESAAAQQQNIDARLWEDPFAAVAKALDKLGKRDLEQECEKKPSDDSACKSPLPEKDNETLVLGVTVSGAPYSEDAEHRRRTRYAVLAGLERAGFVPRDARHIDYFLWPQPTGHASPSVALKIPLFALQPLSQPIQQPPYRNEADTIVSPQPTVVPYEWFEKVSQPRVSSSQDKNILVLWLREEVLKDLPLQKLSGLIKFLHGQRCRTEDESNINFIGPYSSELLRDMVSEAQHFDTSCHDDEVHWPELKNVRFYAYGASAPDSLLLGNLIDSYLIDAYGTVQGYFKKLGVHLQRTIATDDTLARGVVSELKRRKVKPGQAGGDIALISEWDTFYGQTLRQAVESQFALGHRRPGWHRQSRVGLDDHWISRLSYLRGLDGQLPLAEGAEDRKQDKAKTQGDKQTSAADFFKTQTDVKSLDRPIGQGQFDYLRRMSAQLRKIDETLRKGKSKSKITAIGILGSDVFDKLLVLQALRPDFPEALFFTTDFDEAFTMESELPWTRNLIISSSFGPNLNKKFQGEVPSFRDSYQTSAFLAAQLAIGDNWRAPVVSSDQLAEQLSDPSIFEIERSGDVLPLAGYIAPLLAPAPQVHDRKQSDCPKSSRSCDSGQLLAGAAGLTEGRSSFVGGAQESTKEWPCWRNEDGNCRKIQPVIESLFPTFEEGNGEKLGWSLGGGAILVLALHYFLKVPKGARVEVWLAALVLGAGALTCYFWEPIALFLTDNGHGEPIAMLQGVSVWPTVFLRILSIILSIYFVWRAQSSLRNNLVKISDEMKLDLTVPASQDKRTLWNKISGVFDFSLESGQAARTLPLKGGAAWRAYVEQERFIPRFVRAILCTAIMILTFRFVLAPLFGRPTVPVRGDLAYAVHKWTILPDVILMQFLTFFVFDATCFCLLFVNKLRRARTEWPINTMELYKDRLRLQTKLVHEWIGLDFVAKRTRCIGSLIYYPFVLIALLIVSRSTAFANYAPCLTILIAQGISLSVIFGCAIMLCWTATAARETAKQNLMDGIMFAKGHCALDAGAGSDLAQNGLGDNSRDAEQLETLLSRVDQLKGGAFSPFSQQPLVRAVLLPLGSFGWTALIQNGMLGL